MPHPAFADTRLLLLPGLRDSDATHWQSRWEALHGDRRVAQDDWLWPRRGDWMARDRGSEAFDIGPCGHLNGDSGLGDWPQGRALLPTLLG